VPHGSVRHLTRVKLTFTKGAGRITLDPSNFQLGRGATVLAHHIARSCALNGRGLTTPTLQTGRVPHTVSVTNVSDLAATVDRPDTTVPILRLKLAYGFARRAYYFSLTGTDVNSLTSASEVILTVRNGLMW